MWLLRRDAVCAEDRNLCIKMFFCGLCDRACYIFNTIKKLWGIYTISYTIPYTILLILYIQWHWLVHFFIFTLSISTGCQSSSPSLSQALQSNLKYSLLPRRLIIGKRLAQCLHPALPSGVHLKALETYEVIFKIIGTKWLAKDLFIYRWCHNLICTFFGCSC